MNRYEVNKLEDLYNMLDNFTDGVKWDEFYQERKKTPPFILNNKLPDKVIVDFLNNKNVNNVIEFGCGEGRNAIYIAKNNIKVKAIDLSETAINNAKVIAKEQNASVDFECVDIFEKTYQENEYDLAIDSGVFHHLSPHRRLQYREILKKVIKKDGYFLLSCFAEGENVADEINDIEFYNTRRVGVAFSEERIRRFFEDDFDIIDIRKGEQIVNSEFMENSFLYRCIMKKK